MDEQSSNIGQTNRQSWVKVKQMDDLDSVTYPEDLGKCIYLGIVGWFWESANILEVPPYHHTHAISIIRGIASPLY